MALDAADARFMDELFADLDASHFSVPPSQSPPKKKPAFEREPYASPNGCTAKHARSPLKDSTLFQSQTFNECDLEDFFKPSPAIPTRSIRRIASASGTKRQKVEQTSTPTMAPSIPDRRPASAFNGMASTQNHQRCSYTRACVVAVVDSSYAVDKDGAGSSTRTRPEKLLVLETDKHSSNVNQTSPSKSSRGKGAPLGTTETLLASLRDDWMQTLISVGSIVHLVGQFEEEPVKIPVHLEEQRRSNSDAAQGLKCEPKLEVGIQQLAVKQEEPSEDFKDEDDDLWDDLASMPSLSQLATQELLASDDAPRAKIMIFASRSIATKDSNQPDHALDNLLVVHPDVLVPATKVADVASCIRKPIVQDRLRGASDVSLALVMGNMLHELLQACLTASLEKNTAVTEVGTSTVAKDLSAAPSPWPEHWRGIGNFSKSFVEEQVEKQVRSNIESLYAIELSADDAMIQLRDKAAPFAHFARTFLHQEDDTTFHPEATLRESGHSAAAPQSKVRLRRILDVEEEIWSPVYGLKGKVDVSVECDILESPDSPQPKPAAAQQKGAFSRADQQATSSESNRRVTTSVVPLELKTGRAEVVSTEHRAQTIMYTLMMFDRYGVRVNDGLLYYSKSGELHRISRSRNEVRSLIIGRNELAHYLRHNANRLRKSQSTESGEEPVPVLPPTIDSEHKCRRCYAVDGCMLFRRAVENVVEPSEAEVADIEGQSAPPKTGKMLSRRTPIADVFEQKTDHLTEVHLDFFRKWDRLLNLEEEDAVRIRREMWTMTAEQREKVGRCFGNMRLDVSVETPSPAASNSMRRVVHRFVRHQNPTQGADAGLLSGHITVNDPVTISIEPDMLSVAQGFVANLTPTSVEIGLDHPLDAAMQRALVKSQASTQGERFDLATAAERVVFRIDKDELGSGMGRIRANLAALFMTPQRGGDVKRRELVVDLRPPQFAHAEQLQEQTPAGSMQSLLKQIQADTSLNDDQKQAINKVLCTQDYALILGMPGTGKTTTIAKLISILVQLGKRILLTSYTHSAVDTILRKLDVDGARILRLGSRDKVHPDAHRFLLPRCSTLEELKEAFETPNVVAATCLSMHHTFFSSGLAKKMRARSEDSDPTYLFDYCIVDEASQITVPTCLGPLRFADKFVLVGDHHQLPPLVRNGEAKKGGLDVSLFKLLSDKHEGAMVTLRTQYRMNADIMRLSNELVYNGKLKAGCESVRDGALQLNTASVEEKWMQELLQPECKVRWLDTSNRSLDEVGESKHGELVKNQYEAQLVIRIASTLVTSRCSPDQIAVITPYRQQLKLLRQLLPPQLEALELLTADQSQGRDKDVILVSFTRANYSEGAGVTGELLNDLRRLNVTLTRAKKKLVLVGHGQTLEASGVVRPLLELVRRLGWVSVL